MILYLEENKINLDKEYFCGVLKALGWVLIDGQTPNYACGICSMHFHACTENGHLDEKFVKKHVRLILKRLL